jgi:hypothetical protein
MSQILPAVFSTCSSLVVFYLAGPIFAGPEIANQIRQTAKTAIEKMQDSV